MIAAAGIALAADSTYYVDSDWSGTQSGTQAAPWRSLNWSTINTALASGNVTVILLRASGWQRHGRQLQHLRRIRQIDDQPGQPGL